MRKHILRSALIIALLTIICPSFQAAQAAPAAAAQLAPGALDPTFAGFTDAGIVKPAGLDNATSIAVQPDGKIVVVGPTATANEFAVFRYLPNGQLDTTFDGDGKVSIPNMFTVYDVKLQSDGKIVVGGRRNNTGYHLARLTPGGALDTSFSQDGWLDDTDVRIGLLYAILVQSDGKIAACGNAPGGDTNFGVTRYNASGSRDSSFGGGSGIVTFGFGASDTCADMAQQADGKLVLAGEKYAPFSIFDDTDFAVARLNIDGKLDNGFDNDGKLTTGFGGDESGYAVALQPDGKIVVLGGDYGTNTSYMARYNSNGTLDTTFDNDGKCSIPVDDLRELFIQPDGKLLALGAHTSPDGDIKFALHRLLPSGAHDTTFGENGIRFLDFGGQDWGAALDLQPDGRILIGGTMGSAAVLARVWQDGTNFDTGGQQTHGLARPPGANELPSSLAVQSDGKLLVAGEVRSPAGTWSAAFLSRFLPDGQIDAGFGLQGTTLSQAATFSAAHAVAVQNDGKIVIAGYATGPGYTGGSGVTDDFVVTRFLPNGAGDSSFGTGGIYRLDFAGGADRANSVALTPDGKIVVAGSAGYNGRQIWGVARLTSSGAPDPTFTDGAGPGKVLLDFGTNSTAYAVVLQPDGKILLGGKTGVEDFAVARLLATGALDATFGPNGAGYTITDMGGADAVVGLGLAANGWIYAAGYSWRGGTAEDFALAQYQPNGKLPECSSGQTCTYWPGGKRFVNIGGSDMAYALVLRGDNQLVAAGCSDGHMAAAQVSTTDINAKPLLFQTDFVGNFECANGVQFSDATKSKIVVSGWQVYNNGYNIGLARFQTKPQTLVSTSQPSQQANPVAELGTEQDPSSDVDSTDDAEKDATLGDVSTNMNTTDTTEKDTPSEDVSMNSNDIQP